MYTGINQEQEDKTLTPNCLVDRSGSGETLGGFFRIRREEGRQGGLVSDFGGYVSA